MNIHDIVEASDLSRNTRSTALNRAMHQAYSRFPSAKNDMEAFAAWAMDRQNDADELLDRQADLNRRQDAVIKAIDQDNSDQEEHIRSLDQENDELSAELEKVEQQLGLASTIPGAVEQPVAVPAAPAKPKKEPDGSVKITTPFAPHAVPADSADTKDKANTKAGAKAFSAMVPQLDPQRSLPFDTPAPQQQGLNYEPSDNIYMPTKAKTASRFKPGDNVTDIEAKRFSNIAKDIAASPEKLKAAHGIGESIQRLQQLAGTGNRK